MIRLIFTSLFLLHLNTLNAQLPIAVSWKNDSLSKWIETAGIDQSISADSAYEVLSQWSCFPEIKKREGWELVIFKDSVFGEVPLKVFIPENYRSDVASPAVIILHGAVVLSSFKDAYRDFASDDDIFYRFFASKGYIVVRPFADSFGPNADGTKNFDWVVNRFNKKNKGKTFTNPTFASLIQIMSRLKTVLNIDDNRVYAMGHSDGADGAFALNVYTPSSFAGFVAYNSMMTLISSYDIYLFNTKNRPLYLVHSSKDDLRPIQQTRLITNVLDSLNSPVLYKEYTGYQHYDKHLQSDLSPACQWMEGIVRNSFQKSIQWEMSDRSYNKCDWLSITIADTTMQAAPWHINNNVDSYNKRDKKMTSRPYYDLNKSAAVIAQFKNNCFNIYTSRIKEIELFISPVMVNLEDPVTVKVNGVELFNKKVKGNKKFMLENFSRSFDRKALWVTSIKIDIDK